MQKRWVVEECDLFRECLGDGRMRRQEDKQRKKWNWDEEGKMELKMGLNGKLKMRMK